MSECRGPSCHDCKDHERELEAMRVKCQDIHATVAIARCVLVGAAAILLTLLAGCLISNEWTLKQIREVKGRAEVKPAHFDGIGPAFRVEIKPEEPR